MGCDQSLLTQTPRSGWGGRGHRELTLVEKWTEFRDWVRRQRRKNRVVSISIKPQDKSPVTIQQTLNVEQTDPTSSSDNDASAVTDETVEEIKIVETNVSIENDNSRSRVPRPRAAKGKRTPHVSSTLSEKDDTAEEIKVVETNVAIENDNSRYRVPRPKAAKGQRTPHVPSPQSQKDDTAEEIKVVETTVAIENDNSRYRVPRPRAAKGQRTPHVPSPLSQKDVQRGTDNLSTEDEVSKSGTAQKRIRPKAAKGARTRPQEILPGAVAEDTDSVVECSVIRHKTTIDNDVPRSNSLFRRIRPKAAKGKRSVGQRGERSGGPETRTTDECLDAWMKRKLSEEGRG